MNEAIQRLLPAALLTLALHGGLLSLRLHQPEVRPPEPPVQKISVSLKRLPPPSPLKKIVQETSAPPKITPVDHQPIRPLLPKPKPVKPLKKLTVPPRIQPKTEKKKVVRPVPKAVPKPKPLKKAVLPPPVRKKISAETLPPPKIAPIIRQPLKPLAPQPIKTVSVRTSEPKNSRPQPVLRRTTTYQRTYQQQTKPITQPTRHVRTLSSRHIPATRRTVSSAPHKTTTRATPPVSTAVVREAAPLYQSNPPPKYPRMARRRGLEGVVTIEALIDSNGKVVELRIFASSGHRILNKAAMKAVRGWRFTPGTVAGRRQQMRVKVPVRFQLR